MPPSGEVFTQPKGCGGGSVCLSPVRAECPPSPASSPPHGESPPRARGFYFTPPHPRAKREWEILTLSCQCEAPCDVIRQGFISALKQTPPTVHPSKVYHEIPPPSSLPPPTALQPLPELQALKAGWGLAAILLTLPVRHFVSSTAFP